MPPDPLVTVIAITLLVHMGVPFCVVEGRPCLGGCISAVVQLQQLVLDTPLHFSSVEVVDPENLSDVFPVLLRRMSSPFRHLLFAFFP